MALNGYLPREGDILTIRAKVKYDVEAGEDTIHIRPIGAFSDVSVPLNDTVDLYSRHWNEGDKVTLESHPGIGTVLSVCDSMVWVKFSIGTPKTIAANNLMPAPKEETQP